jgi:hypothetical protein
MDTPKTETQRDLEHWRGLPDEKLIEFLADTGGVRRAFASWELDRRARARDRKLPLTVATIAAVASACSAIAALANLLAR